MYPTPANSYSREPGAGKEQTAMMKFRARIDEHTYSWYIGRDIAHSLNTSLMEYADTRFDNL